MISVTNSSYSSTYYSTKCHIICIEICEYRLAFFIYRLAEDYVWESVLQYVLRNARKGNMDNLYEYILPGTFLQITSKFTDYQDGNL